MWIYVCVLILDKINVNLVWHVCTLKKIKFVRQAVSNINYYITMSYRVRMLRVDRIVRWWCQLEENKAINYIIMARQNLFHIINVYCFNLSSTSIGIRHWEFGLRRKYRVSSIEPNFGIDRYQTFCGIEPALIYPHLYLPSHPHLPLTCSYPFRGGPAVGAVRVHAAQLTVVVREVVDCVGIYPSPVATPLGAVQPWVRFVSTPPS